MVESAVPALRGLPPSAAPEAQSLTGKIRTAAFLVFPWITISSRASGGSAGSGIAARPMKYAIRRSPRCRSPEEVKEEAA
jgi:hypothetical protein